MEKLRRLQESSLKKTLENQENWRHCNGHGDQIEITVKRCTDELAQDNVATLKELSQFLNDNDEKRQEMLSKVTYLSFEHIRTELICSWLGQVTTYKLTHLRVFYLCLYKTFVTYVFKPIYINN